MACPGMLDTGRDRARATTYYERPATARTWSSGGTSASGIGPGTRSDASTAPAWDAVGSER